MMCKSLVFLVLITRRHVAAFLSTAGRPTCTLPASGASHRLEHLIRTEVDGLSASASGEEDVAALRSVTFAALDSSAEPQLLADFLMEVGACSTAITDHDRDTPDEIPIFREPDLDEDWAVICGDAAVGTNVWKRCDVTAHFPATFDLRGVAEMVKDTFEFPETPQYSVESVPDRDWVIHVQSSWKPIVVSGFVLRFPWHTEEDVAEALDNASAGDEKIKDAVQLRLEGGIAFGTGEHPTTQLCLGFLRDAVQNYEARKILDYGAGSGVLGLAACALSTDVEAIGVEIDVDAVRIADYNAVTNKLNMRSYLPPARLLGEEGDSESASVMMKGQVRAENVETLPKEWDGPLFDACAANILAGPLIGLAGTISSMVRPGGRLGLSGILKNQAEKVMEAYSEYFDNVELAGEDGGWVLITGERAAHCDKEVP